PSNATPRLPDRNVRGLGPPRLRRASVRADNPLAWLVLWTSEASLRRRVRCLLRRCVCPRGVNGSTVGNHHTDHAVVSAEGFVNHNIWRATMPTTQRRNQQGQNALVTGATAGSGGAVALLPG